MTAIELVNAMVWPGNLGQLLACTGRIIIKPGHLPVDVLRLAADKHRAAEGWESKPWLEVTVRLDRRHQSFPRREIVFAVPASAEIEPLAESVHRVALHVLESELLDSARLSGGNGIDGRVWKSGGHASLREMPADACWMEPT